MNPADLNQIRDIKNTIERSMEFSIFEPSLAISSCDFLNTRGITWQILLKVYEAGERDPGLK